MQYVGRYNNGTGFMEWAGQPVDSIGAAKAQVEGDYCSQTDVDVIHVEYHLVDGKTNMFEGEVVASAPLGRGW